MLVALGTVAALAGTAHAAVNARRLRRPDPDPPPSTVDISVLLPVRDEAANVAGCLRTLLAQPDVEVLVLDDGSADETRAIAESFGVRVLAGTPPPSGWLGKPHACRQLAAAARPSSHVLVFVDADVRLGRHAVAAAVDLLQRHDLDFVSPYPRQVAGTAAERLVQPLLQWSWLTLLPLRAAERSARASLAVANGQFLVVRRDAYERAGGHRPDDVLDDLALARALRRSGARGGVVDGTTLASCRMYDGWAALRDGYGKSLWAAFGGPVGAAGVLAGLAVAYLVPAVAALRGSRIGALGYAAGVAGRALTARRTGGRPWPDALAHPASIATLAYLTGRSFVGHRRGTLRWRRRTVSQCGR
ncbi:MAG TPA: glycosyltransferase [Jatrophihabitantaceae bacterium]